MSAVALALAVPTVQAGDDVKEELREMRDMVLQLQDQMAAQQATIDTQQKVIQEVGLEDGSRSAISSFLENTEFSGWVKASYNYNVHNDGSGGLPGQSFTLPFHPDSN
ncbi:MAG: hypothetical protein O7G30_01955, partial [Proteobacteria bacterium]|nr:hypothetical protein [Pseudomonadota bacterium]